jgi:AraC-like DNA-binding protein
MISAGPTPAAADLAVLSMRCIAAAPCSTYDWHSHPFFEFSFVSDDDATIGYPPGMRAVERDTLLFYHVGENHAGWSGPNQTPRFWVVHFTMPAETLAQFAGLKEPAAERRAWRLRQEHAEAFRWMFLQMLNERLRPREFQSAAESAWLRLLLISVHRWITGDTAQSLTPAVVNPELVRLWHLVNASVGQPAQYLEQIHMLPNYDSLRHGFKRAFGCSPRDMMLRLRIQHAKNLLLESNLSIKEIADRCGYQRQHEFARAFRQHTGAAPTVWRAQPYLRAESR